MTDHRTEPRWLDAEEQHAWRNYLRTERLLETALDRDLQKHGVQLSEYEVLSMLSESPERHMRMSTLADLVVQSRSRLTHTAARLERRGWVDRRPAPVDRRGVELYLTADGLTALQEMAKVHVESVRCNLTDHLTREEFLALGRAMHAIGAGIRSAPGGEDRDKGADAC
ncbi:MAG TPA: MarR family transcriptional regulator [Segeticoccus sp.]|uniref:MarR family winged helix-turn-helix transcriptional regulator n=1 Tax=Segeticoccus sp. TaxID=2706531 RepID=UPI002D807FCE|nr:MarR family transcriptional regulator [Segeticoccus sp.]HET8601067.1 MarR family transcriptional regulator [Segeticoccus sp.]